MQAKFLLDLKGVESELKVELWCYVLFYIILL